MTEIKSYSQDRISNSTFSAEMLDADKYNKWIVNYYRKYLSDPLLEIGLGHGTFYQYFPSPIKNYVGLDIDEKLVEHARKLYPHNTYICDDLASQNFVEKLNKKTFNSVICFNVLEHIEDHEQALKNMLNILSPTGHLLLFVPAFQALYTDLDHLAGHYRRYKIADLASLAHKCGGNITEWSYFNFIGGIGWWVNKFMKHSSLNDSRVNYQIRLFNRVILPFSKLIQPFSKKFFGQSLYAVLKKDS